jgi:NADPH:quinone reductase-like Zn-dependent oxidoreductase
MTVVTTASPSNFELVKSRGADAVFDYNSPTCASDIKAYTKNSLRYVYDCVSTEAAFAIIAEALPSNDGEKIQVVTHLPADAWPRKDIKPTTILAYTSIGEPFSKFGMDLPAMPNHYEHARMFWELSGKLLAEGKIKAHPVALRSGGLGGIPDGFAEFTSGKVRGAKLVYIVEETGEVGEGQEAAIVAPKLGKQWETEKLA